MKTLSALLLISSLGCHDTPTYPLMDAIEGHWTLRTVNGSPLPVTIADTVTLSGTFSATRGSFTSATVIRTPATGAVEQTTSRPGLIYCGHVGCSPLQLVFGNVSAEADAMPEGQTLTISLPGRTMVYVRE